MRNHVLRHEVGPFQHKQMAGLQRAEAKWPINIVSRLDGGDTAERAVFLSPDKQRRLPDLAIERTVTKLHAVVSSC